MCSRVAWPNNNGCCSVRDRFSGVAFKVSDFRLRISHVGFEVFVGFSIFKFVELLNSAVVGTR